jgi:S-DNA-T family DNA segregation ATPase FtsK/SpoIIIE
MIAEGWERFEERTFSVFEPIPLGVDEEGNDVSVPLYQHHMLIGGEPGAGKSVTLSVLLCAAALDPSCELWLLDGKLIELSSFKPVATRFVGPVMEEAIATLDELKVEMAARYERLQARDEKKVRPGDGERLIVLCVDELAYYVAGVDKKTNDAFASRLRDVVQRGRAAGIIVVAATQKPSTDLVPSALRDNFTFRLAHRCTTLDASDTILGSGWAAEGFSASSIDGATRGVGFLIAEIGQPRRIRTYYLNEPDIARIVRRGYELRGGR